MPRRTEKGNEGETGMSLARADWKNLGAAIGAKGGRPPLCCETNTERASALERPRLLASTPARSRATEARRRDARGAAEAGDSTEAWRALQEQQGAQWEHVPRPEIESALECLLADKERQRATGVAWVVGPVGTGKSYAAQFTVQRVMRQAKSSNAVVLAFGMKAVAQSSFPVLLGVFQRSLTKQLLEQHAALLASSPFAVSRLPPSSLPPRSESSEASSAAAKPLRGPWICSAVEAAAPSFRADVAALLRAAAASPGASAASVRPPFGIRAGVSPADAKERHVRALRFAEMLEDDAAQPFAQWRGLLEFLLTQVPSFARQARLSERDPCDATSAAFGLLRMAAAHAENMEAAAASQDDISEYPTGQKWLQFFVAVLNAYTEATGACLSLWIDDVEILCVSRFLDERGPLFLSALNRIFLSPLTSAPLVLITADSLTSVRGVCLTPAERTEERHDAEREEMREQDEARRGRRNIEVVEVGDLSRQAVTDILVPRVTSIPEIPQALYVAVGGNCALLEKIAKGLMKLNGELWLEANRPLPPDHVKQVRDPDEAELARDATEEEERDWRWCERQKEFCRNITQDLLVEDVRLFEWRMNKFLALPLLEQLRQKQENEVHFLVTVFETIRYLLSRPYLLCKDLLHLDNVVILGLLDAGLLTVRFQPSRVQVSNEMYRHLLADYINVRYSLLSVDEKAKYNMNLLLNEKAIKFHVDRLSDF
ncbi:hypothetical protein BESB_034230 [Besnoitia besnoiti]|uniref:Uncharacterized protein n=1 Tax=Besnoitia besnoiti TaxID=94643 RepID=A0A2A9MG51_BESBE|nr:hypothetical protein BESB_034230 [Besnoitia besnoiti]PFH36965.1 hypothetical protein BESB_034230 [Besnoitia besnoiti]